MTHCVKEIKIKGILMTGKYFSQFQYTRDSYLTSMLSLHQYTDHNAV